MSHVSLKVERQRLLLHQTAAVVQFLFDTNCECEIVLIGSSCNNNNRQTTKRLNGRSETFADSSWTLGEGLLPLALI